MADDTNTAERETLMDLIDAYAEARHVGGCHTYNAKTAEARAKVVASLAASAGSEPVAWQHRIGPNDAWFKCTKEFHDWVLRVPEEWPGNEVRALYTPPSPPEGMAGWKPTFDMRAVVAVAVTMLYETHPEDVCRVFDLRELEKIVSITALLGSQQVEDIYRSAWDHLATPPLPASEAKEL